MYIHVHLLLLFYVHTFSLDFFLCHIPFHCGRTIQNKLKTKHCHKCPKPTTKHNKCGIILREYIYKIKKTKTTMATKTKKNVLYHSQITNTNIYTVNW